MEKSSQKIIALMIGVLVLAITANYFAFAWIEPTSVPPNDNILAPINTGSSAQTKTGGLTVSSLTATGASPQIDMAGGIIRRANYLTGDNDLQLHSDDTNPVSAKIDLGNGASDKIEFYTNDNERMRIEGNGDIYINGLSDCFLSVDGDGRMECYDPPGPPINKTFTSAKSTIFEISRSSDGTSEDFYTVVDDEAVAKIAMNAVSVYSSIETWSCGSAPYIKSSFYIKEAGATEWGDARESIDFFPYCYMHYGLFHDYCRCSAGSKSGYWYYHLSQGDEIKIATEVYEGSVPFGGVQADLTGSAIAENLTFNRDITEYVSCEEGKDILYYLGANATGEMWKVRERYSPENPIPMTTTADGFSIDLLVQ